MGVDCQKLKDKNILCDEGGAGVAGGGVDGRVQTFLRATQDDWGGRRRERVGPPSQRLSQRLSWVVHCQRLS